MHFGDRAADIEPHAHPLGLGRVEGVKELRLLLFVDPWTVVHYAEFDVCASFGVKRIGFGRNALGVHFDRTVFALRGRFDGIFDEIQKHLLEHHAVAQKERNAFFDAHVDLGIGLSRLNER